MRTGREVGDGAGLSLRLPTLILPGPGWLSHGMRGPGIAVSEEAQGSAQLEVALLASPRR